MLKGLWCLVAFAAPVVLHAQSRFEELEVGTRVRIAAPSIPPGRIIGVVESRRGDTLSVRQSDKLLFDVPLTAISTLAVYRGRSHAKGASRGLLIGAGVGAIVGFGMSRDPFFGTEVIPLAILAGGATFGTLGALIGTSAWGNVLPPAARSARLYLADAKVGLHLSF